MPAIGKDPNLPNYARPEYGTVAADLILIADELGGTRSMHANSARYIRKWKAEKKPNYDIRRLCETFFEGLGRTLSAALGMLFAKPPAVVWNGGEKVMEPHWLNIDAAGTAGVVFVKRFAEAAIRDGLALLLVDHPPAPANIVVTAANEEALNLRPIWAMYERSSAINWHSEVVNNQRTLVLLVLYEPSHVRNGKFGTATRHRYRVLRLVSELEARELMGDPMTQAELNAIEIMPMRAVWELFELQEGGAGDAMDQFVRINSGSFLNRNGEAAEKLPISIAYTGRSDAPMDAKIPLMGVAWANLSHWQLSTDLRFNTIVASFAQPTVSGRFITAEDGKAQGLEIGPLVSVHLEQGGKFEWVEAAGTGLERLSKLVQGKLQEMAAMGMSFLATDTRAAETAEAKRLDASAENATLATSAQGIEDAVNMALETHAWYVGIEKQNAPVITISRDYESVALDSAVMVAYIQAVADAGLPVRLLLEAWQQGGRIPADADLDALEMEIMANQQAIADQKAEAAAALAATKSKPALVP